MTNGFPVNGLQVLQIGNEGMVHKNYYPITDHPSIHNNLFPVGTQLLMTMPASPIIGYNEALIIIIAPIIIGNIPASPIPIPSLRSAPVRSKTRGGPGAGERLLGGPI